jgi:hypothetical protein
VLGFGRLLGFGWLVYAWQAVGGGLVEGGLAGGARPVVRAGLIARGGPLVRWVLEALGGSRGGPGD